MDKPAKVPFLARHEFLVRRLHSLSGLVPVGAYLCIHLLTNASVLNGPESFQRQVDSIHSLGRALPLVEWVFIFIPLLFHGIVGLLMIRGAVPNTGSYPFVGNIRYTLQRATGMIAFAFIAWHVIQMHATLGAPLKDVQVFPLPTGAARFDHERATTTAAGAIRAKHVASPGKAEAGPAAFDDDIAAGRTGFSISALGVQALYAVGILACVFHLANGLWTMGITWGVWTTPAAQRRANWVCGAFGVVLAVIGLSALYGMSTVDLAHARAVEQAQAAARQEWRARVEQNLKAAQQPARPVEAAAQAARVGNE